MRVCINSQTCGPLCRAIKPVKQRMPRACSAAVMLMPVLLFLASTAGHAADKEELFKVDAAAIETQIDSDIGKVEGYLLQNNLREGRSFMQLVTKKVEKYKKEISKEKRQEYLTRLNGMNQTVAYKEDSLVKRTIQMLKTDGMEAAVNFMQRDLRTYGVTEQKLGEIDKAIMELGPQIQESQQQEQIGKAVKVLEDGGTLDASVPSTVVEAAQRVIKNRQDSLRTLIAAKERQRQAELDKARQDSVLAAKKEAEHQAALQKARADSLAAIQKAERARMNEMERAHMDSIAAERQHMAALEKARQDSVANAKTAEERARQDSLLALQRKIQALLAEKEQTERKAALARARQDSIINAERMAVVEKARQDSLMKARTESERRAAIAQARQDSISRWKSDSTTNALLEIQRRAAMEKSRRDSLNREQQRLVAIQRAHDDSISRWKSDSTTNALLEMQRRAVIEKSRRDSLYREQQRLTGIQKVRADSISRWKQDSTVKMIAEAARLARTEKARQDSLFKWRKDSSFAAQNNAVRTAKTEKARADSISKARADSIKYVEGERKKKADAEAYRLEQVRLMQEDQIRSEKKIADMRRSVGLKDTEGKKGKYAGRIITLSADTTKKDEVENADKAQTYSIDIYAWLEQGKVDLAYSKFQKIRESLRKYLDAEAFSTLDKIVTDSYRAKRDQDQHTRDSLMEAKLGANKPQTQTREDVIVDDIYNLMQSEKIKEAYKLFNANERKLQNYLPKEKFEGLKSRVMKQYQLMLRE